jgi:hypothetical protein
MQHYKNYSVYTTAVSANGVWHGTAVVLDPRDKVAREIKRIETAPDFLFLSKDEAEEFVFKLCKGWIDSTETTRNYSPTKMK